MKACHIDSSISARVQCLRICNLGKKQVQQAMLKDLLQQMVATSLPNKLKKEVLTLHELCGTTACEIQPDDLPLNTT